MVRGLGKQIGKTYAIFLIGVAVAVAAVAQVRFASLGPDWLPDEARRAYVEGLLITGATFLWIVVTLIGGAIAHVFRPALLTVVAALVISTHHYGTSDRVLARALFDPPEFGAYLGDVGQVVTGPLLLAPAIGALAAPDLWRLLGWMLGWVRGQVPRPVRNAVVQVGIPAIALVASDVAYALHMRDDIDDAAIAAQLPRVDSEWQVVQGSLRMTAWPEYDIVEYRIHRKGEVWDVFLFPDGRAGFGRSDDGSRDYGSSPAEISMEMEPATPVELAQANCWACPD